MKAFIFLFASLALFGDNSFAQEAYGTYGYYPSGSSRILAMGGAFVGLSDDASAAHVNPAGLVLARWRFDVSSDDIRIINKEVDLGTDGRADGLPYSASNTSFASRFKSFGIAAGQSTQYDLAYDFGGLSLEKNIIQVKSQDFALAMRLSKSFSFGATAHQESALVALEQSGSTTESKAENTYYTYGILFRPNSKFGFGVSYQPERLYEMDTSHNTTLGTTWFKNIYIPEKTSMGFLISPSQKLKWTFDIDKYGFGKNVVYVGSAGTYYLEQTQTIMRTGFEYTIISDKDVDFIWRGGGYKEPSRISGLSSRLHFTMGVSFRWGIFTFGAAYDQATDFSTTSQSAGISFSALSKSI